MNAVSKEALERQDIEALLPWHAAGTLNRRDAQRVEQALAADQELRRHFEIVREELAETIRLNESLGAPSTRAMDKLFAAIEAEAAPRRARSLGLSARIAEFMAGFSPRSLALAGGAAAVALLLQAGIIAGVMVKENSARTELASFKAASAPTAANALVRFAPDATADDITRLLEANNAKLVGGPLAGGVYNLRIGGAGVSEDEVARTIQAMQANRLVGFVAKTQSAP